MLFKIKRSRIYKVYDKLHYGSVVACLALAGVGFACISYRVGQILFFPQKEVPIQDSPDIQRLLALKQRAEKSQKEIYEPKF